MATSAYLPLRWESTWDQWWYAAPIDWAAANGLSDLVKHLLHVDPNLLIKLTSLRRIRRLESVWDDADPTNGVARCRAHVAQDLLSGPLIRAGYGGWLLYTAASAGDVGFVRRLVEGEEVSVFGEGEFGITDILYAAARSKSGEVFRVLFEFAVSEGCGCGGLRDGFLWEMKNRAVHSAARGGNLEILKEFLVDCADILVYRDVQGSTLLHSAASRSQIEIVEYLITTYANIISATDNQGNTALHIAAYRGYSSVLEAFAAASLSLVASRNNNGDTFLHLAVEGFRSPGFHRNDQHIELMKQLVSGRIFCLKNLINITNHEGRTALHISVAHKIHLDVVQLLVRVPSIDLNIVDVHGFTPLDLLKQYPETPTSEILIRQIASAGGISGCLNQNDENNLMGMKTRGIGTSPGTSFRLADAELCNGNDSNSELSCELGSSRFSSCSSDHTIYLDSPSNKRLYSKRFKLIPGWFMKTSKKGPRNSEHIPTPLREKFARGPSIQATPPKSVFSSARFSKTSCDHRETNNGGRTRFFSGPLSMMDGKLQENDKHRRVGSFNKSSMNQYFCFGAQGLAVEDSITYTQENRNCRKLVF